MILTMNSYLTWRMNTPQMNLTRLQAGHSWQAQLWRSARWKNALAKLATAADSIWARDHDTKNGE